MSGFLLQRLSKPSGRTTLRLVDTGNCEAASQHQSGETSAFWTYPVESPHWKCFRRGQRKLVIEGQPDRYPHEDEPVENWIAGRWGSFRGFEISEPSGEITIFNDPLGTRDVFYRNTAQGLWASDKQTSIVLNTGPLDLCWGPLLQLAAIGSLMTPDTSFQGIRLLDPGTMIRFRIKAEDAPAEEVPISRNKLPLWEGLAKEEVQANPSGSLFKAMKTAVAESWTDSNSMLLLSGGLDSRFVLGLATGKRRCATFDLKPSETAIVKEIARAAGTEAESLPFPENQWLTLGTNGYLLSGGSHEVQFLTHLDCIHPLRTVSNGLVNAYLFDTLLKGYFLTPPASGAHPGEATKRYLGAVNPTLVARGRRNSCGIDVVDTLLSSDGTALLANQLRPYASRLRPQIEDGLDVAFERLALERISRQVHYSSLNVWMDAHAVQSPIFHPALWTWHHWSTAADRNDGAALRAALMESGLPVASVIDANTGTAIRRGVPMVGGWSASIRGTSTFRGARRILSQLGVLGTKPPKDPRFAGTFRQGPGRDVLEAGLSSIKNEPPLQAGALDAALNQFLKGDPAAAEPLLTLASIGQLRTLARTSREFRHKYVRTSAAKD